MIVFKFVKIHDTYSTTVVALLSLVTLTLIPLNYIVFQHFPQIDTSAIVFVTMVRKLNCKDGL